VDRILCEDTRVTKNLLDHFEIDTPVAAYHQHTDERKVNQILDLLARGKDLALVSDAGTPGISDPGGKLVQAVLERFDGATEDEPRVKIESVPGPSAVTAALSISGIPTDKFVFMGFPPHKKGRQKFLRKAVESEYPVVVYESKHRILKFLEELNEMNEQVEKEMFEAERRGEKPGKARTVSSVVVCRELSKMYETVYRGEILDIKDRIEGHRDDQKGEFVVIVGK
jgi:16S rRNA (cytidine1402-2'-O)-methyltransferase